MTLKKLVLACTCAAMTGVLAGVPLFAQAGGPGRAAPAPPPGSPATYRTSAELMSALKAAVEKSPTTAMSPIGLTDEYSINVVRRGSGASAITHPGWTELHYILDGGATFITGGTLSPQGSPGGRGVTALTIEGGVSRHVTKGDVVLVPADTPHWYKDVDGFVTYLEVRFIAPRKYNAGK